MRSSWEMASSLSLCPLGSVLYCVYCCFSFCTYRDLQINLLVVIAVANRAKRPERQVRSSSYCGTVQSSSAPTRQIRLAPNCPTRKSPFSARKLLLSTPPPSFRSAPLAAISVAARRGFSSATTIGSELRIDRSLTNRDHVSLLPQRRRQLD